jgi:CheY-like chemotaxis protein
MMVTTSQAPDARQRGFDLGIVGLVSKPFQPDTFRALMATLARYYRSSRAGPGSVAAPRPDQRWRRPAAQKLAAASPSAAMDVTKAYR